MRHTVFALALALAAETTEVRADILHYNMTGTITSQRGGTTGFLLGYHISWPLYLDRSGPMTSSANTSSSYGPSTIIPHFSGITVPNDINTSSALWSLKLSNSPAGNLLLSDTATYAHGALSLMVNGSLPSLNLANLELSNIPFELGKGSGSYLSYYYADAYGQPVGFTATVDSISGPIPYAAEPGSLTLFLLGAAGLATHVIRRRLRFRLVSFLAVADAG